MTNLHDDQPDPNREWWTPHEVADLFRVHITTVYRWISVGKLPAIRISRNLYRIKAEDVRKLAGEEEVQTGISVTPEELDERGHLLMGEGE